MPPHPHPTGSPPLLVGQSVPHPHLGPGVAGGAGAVAGDVSGQGAVGLMPVQMGMPGVAGVGMGVGGPAELQMQVRWWCRCWCWCSYWCWCCYFWWWWCWCWWRWGSGKWECCWWLCCFDKEDDGWLSCWCWVFVAFTGRGSWFGCWWWCMRYFFVGGGVIVARDTSGAGGSERQQRRFLFFLHESVFTFKAMTVATLTYCCCAVCIRRRHSGPFQPRWRLLRFPRRASLAHARRGGYVRWRGKLVPRAAAFQPGAGKSNRRDYSQKHVFSYHDTKEMCCTVMRETQLFGLLMLQICP